MVYKYLIVKAQICCQWNELQMSTLKNLQEVQRTLRADSYINTNAVFPMLSSLPHTAGNGLALKSEWFRFE